MAKPRIRHLALFARDPEKVAKFYQEVFEMDLIPQTEAKGACYLTDGYLTLAVLPHRLKGSSAVGLNHFGFSVDDSALYAKRIVAAGLEEPKDRPADRPYAEQRGCDPEGNMFDLSEHGFEDAETAGDRQRKAVPA